MDLLHNNIAIVPLVRALKVLFINYPEDELRLLIPLISSKVIEPIVIYSDIKSLITQSISDLDEFDIIYLARRGWGALDDLSSTLMYYSAIKC